MLGGADFSSSLPPARHSHLSTSSSPAASLLCAEKLGTGFALVKSDVGGNIDRLATRAATNPVAYEPDVFQIVRDEVAAGTQGGSSSCTKGLLWLKR